MTTGSPQPQPASLESEQRAHEPSMEEILASIRRIIADDDALPLMRRPSLVTRDSAAASPRADVPRQSPTPPVAPVHLVAVPDVAEPSEMGEPPATHSPAAERPESLPVVEPGWSGAEEDAVEDRYELRSSVRDGAAAKEEPAPAVPATRSSTEPAGALTGEQHKSSDTRLVSATTDASVASSFQSLATSMFLRDSDLVARTAREMLRPMLKQWLDDNLPVMVERLVRAEIERVARGGR